MSIPKIDFAELSGGAEPELDPETVEPGMHYRFIQERKVRMARARGRQGYKPVLRSSGVKLLGEGRDEESADDLIRDGDRVLCACPEERYRKRSKGARAIAEAKLHSPVEQFKRKASRTGKAMQKEIRVSTDEREDKL